MTRRTLTIAIHLVEETDEPPADYTTTAEELPEELSQVVPRFSQVVPRFKPVLAKCSELVQTRRRKVAL